METTQTFTEWLGGQAKRNTATGDLARDAAEDPHWPAGGTTMADFAEHLRRQRASDDAMQALRQAWQSYRRAVRRREDRS